MKEILQFVVAAPAGHFQGSLMGMILGAGPMVQMVLVILLAFSIVSWAIILTKFFSFRAIKRENDLFFDTYLKSSRLAECFAETKGLSRSTVAEVFRSGYTELVKVSRPSRDQAPNPGSDQGGGTAATKGVDNVERALSRAVVTETARLEGLLGFLATTGNACPFIGLFGTVWGIMDTFKGIGARGSATLAVVAPGISEALIATAAGLAAAIPAVIFYNYYLSRVRDHQQEMESFALEFMNLTERQHFRS